MLPAGEVFSVSLLMSTPASCMRIQESGTPVVDVVEAMVVVVEAMVVVVEVVLGPAVVDTRAIWVEVVGLGVVVGVVASHHFQKA